MARLRTDLPRPRPAPGEVRVRVCRPGREDTHAGDLRLLHDGRVDVGCLIAARYALYRAEQALAHAARPGVLKVLIDVDPA